MKIATCVAACAAILLGACASSEPYPTKRPLKLEHFAAMAPVNISLVEPEQGIVATWFARDSAGGYQAQYGLIGVLTVALMEASINAGPEGAAQAAADKIATVETVDKISKSLREQMIARKGAPATEPLQVSFGDIVTTQKFVSPNAVDGVVEINLDYRISADLQAMTVVATATYQRPDLKYASPYAFKSVPEEELTGPVYRNVFVYESNHLPGPPPALTPERKQKWVDEIKQRYSERLRKLPEKQGDKGYRPYRDELSEAKNDVLSLGESTEIILEQWVKDNGAFVAGEIEQAHAYIAKYLLIDLNSTAVPSLTGSDQVVEQLPDGRTVRLVGGTTAAGGYVSSPGDVTTLTSYGNAIRIAKVNSDRSAALREAAKKKP